MVYLHELYGAVQISVKHYRGGGTTLILTLRTAVPVALAICFRTDSVK
jgi:hypothetical protein